MTEKLPYFRQLSIPAHIRERYPNFIEFLKAYFEWLSIGPAQETQFTTVANQSEITIGFRPLTNIRILVDGVEQEFTLDYDTGVATLSNPIVSRWTQVTIIRDPNAGYAITKLGDLRDIDKTSDTFLQWFRETYLHNFPVYTFTNNFHQEFSFAVQNTIENAFILDCVCAADTIKQDVATGQSAIIDSFSTQVVRTLKWLVHVKDYLGRTSSYQVLAVATNNSVDYTIYSTLGSAVTHTPTVTISDGNVRLHIDNQTGGVLHTAIVRAPTFVETTVLVPNRTFMVNAPITSRSVIKVYHNSVLIDGSYIVVGPNTNFCGDSLHEIRISEEYPTEILVGDIISIVVDERNKIDERLLIKNIQKVYASKGTETATRLLFKILYNEDIQIDYPSRRILKASDGKWDNEKKMIRVTANRELFEGGLITDLLYRTININKWNALFERYDVVATGVVERVERRSAGGFLLADIYLSNYQEILDYGFSVYGSILETSDGYMPNEYISCEFITLDGEEVSIQEQIVPSLNTIKILSEGTGYSQGQRLQFSEGYDYIIPFNWNGDSTIPHFLSANLTDGTTIAQIVHYPSVDLGSPSMASPFLSEVINPPYLRFNGSVIEADVDPRLNEGDLIEIRVRAADGYAAIGAVDGSGNIQRIDVYEAGIGYVSATSVSLSGGAGASIVIDDTESLTDVDGRFLNYDGHLSSLPVLQDGRYYNPYTYVIKSSQQLETYRQILIDLIHPAGFGVFGDIQLLVCLEMMIRSWESELSYSPKVIDNDESVSDRENVALGPTYHSFDGRKFLYGEESQIVRVFLTLIPTGSTLLDQSLIGEIVSTASSPISYGRVVGWIKEQALLVLEPVGGSPELPFYFEVADDIIMTTSSPYESLGVVMTVEDVVNVSNDGNMTIQEVEDISIEPFIEREWSSFEYLPDSEINTHTTRT